MYNDDREIEFWVLPKTITMPLHNTDVCAVFGQEVK